MAYSGTYILGDSLVDSGNALRLALFYGGLPFTDLPEGAPTSDLGYFQGRFSNGYVFTDLISNKAIGLVSQPVFPYGFEDPWLGLPLDPFASDPSGRNLNFAYGGAHIIQRDEAVPELDAQTDALRDAYDGHADPNALYIFTFGGNDVRDLAPTASDPMSADQAYAELRDIAAKYLHELNQVIDDGARHIVITGLADVGLIPKYDRDGNGMLDATEQMRSDAATDYSVYLDMLIRTQVIPALQQHIAAKGGDPNGIVYVPLMDYLDSSGNLVTGALNANLSTLAALNNVTPPAGFSGTAAEYLASQLEAHTLEYRNMVFFDGVHPNAQAHALLASYMQSSISGAPWIETMPYLGADVDYRMTGTISAAGEVDSLNVYMVAGTNYTFQMLGVSTVTPYVLDQLDVASLSGTVLADPSLRLLSSGGSFLAGDDDSGIGLDASLSFNASAAGTYTVQLSAVGSVTGSYILTATVSGAAMQAGNSYTVSSPSTLVIEGAGGIGVDVVKASVSYGLAAGSEIEVLRTTNDKGKGAINLTGNEFDQQIVGNNGANVLEGKGGSDQLWGGSGNDRFVLSNTAVTRPDGSQVDHIMDYGKGDVVDLTQILSVASAANVTSGGYLRVTTSGLVQVDLDGGGNNWVTLSTVNGTGAVTIRSLSGGAAKDISVNRTADAFTAAVAAAGIAAAPAATEPSFPVDHTHTAATVQTFEFGQFHSAEPLAHQPTVIEAKVPIGDLVAPPPAATQHAFEFVAAIETATHLPAAAPSELLQGTDAPTIAPSDVAMTIAMPSADMVQALAAPDEAAPKSTGEVGRVLAEALTGGATDGSLDHLLATLPHAGGGGPAAVFGDDAVAVAFAAAHPFAVEAFVAHQDLAAIV